MDIVCSSQWLLGEPGHLVVVLGVSSIIPQLGCEFVKLLIADE